MRNNRYQSADRRQTNVMPHLPFKDSDGATVRECRRKLPDRRINNVHGEWIEEIVIR